MKKKPEELVKTIDYTPKKDWMEPAVDFRKGTYCFASKPKPLEYLELPNPRDWRVEDKDWKLPANWKEIILEGMKDRLNKYRSFKLFMDICVRCGACVDKCPFFIGTGDPKNMPVIRAELIRSVYRRYFTWQGKFLGKIAGARELTEDVLKEWYNYFYQCAECRRCALFCPYGIDNAEITMMARELLNLVGCSPDWITVTIANCYRTGNHLGYPPATIKSVIETAIDDIETTTGVKVEASISRKGAEILFVPLSGELAAIPHYYTLLGYLMLFHEIGLDYTFSAYATEGGNFGFFLSNEAAKRLHAKIKEEAQRLKVKWILGGECGHMWRVWHQYHNSWFGPFDFLEEPVSPITGTKFENAKYTRMVHICEFTADLIKHNKIKLDPSRNDHWIATYHDPCNVARGVGLLEEPRYIIRNVCNNFYEMPPNTIRERTFCCGSGAGLNPDDNIEIRLRGGLPRANAVKYVREKHGVNLLLTICAIDKATLTTLMDYWVPGVEVGGVHELLGNALVMKGEKERTTDLRGKPLLKKKEGQ